MISIENGKERGYVDARPVIVASHRLSREDIVKTIRLGVAHFGFDLLREAGVIEELAQLERKEKESGEFYCFVEHGGVPSVLHDSKGDAIIEARRLAEKTRSKTLVLKKIAVVEARCSVTVEEVK